MGSGTTLTTSLPSPTAQEIHSKHFREAKMAQNSNSTKVIRIGTRKSNMAVIQAESIRASLQQLAPDLTFELRALPVIGDKDQTTALYSFGDKSLWTSELEELLTSDQLDLIVHCLKDMPTKLPDTCDLAAIPARDDPRDALVVKKGLPYTNLTSLPEGAVVGTSSLRRMAQLRRRFPHLKFASLRGNVETRLRKVDDPEGEYTCMVISAAGLVRVGLPNRITQYLGTKDGGIMHAVGQGALGLEIRKGDEQTLALLNKLADEKSTLACLAERSLLRTLEGGCSVPIGVETEWVDTSTLKMAAIVVSIDGTESVEDILQRPVKTHLQAEQFGHELAGKLLDAGAGAILQAIKQDRPLKE